MRCSAGGPSRLQSMRLVTVVVGSFGEAVLNLQLPDGQEEHWRELLLLGQGDAQYVDDPRGSSKLLATCSVHPLTRAFKVTIEDAC